jgi:hypothetical protein
MGHELYRAHQRSVRLAIKESAARKKNDVLRAQAFSKLISIAPIPVVPSETT